MIDKAKHSKWYLFMVPWRWIERTFCFKQAYSFMCQRTFCVKVQISITLFRIFWKKFSPEKYQWTKANHQGYHGKLGTLRFTYISAMKNACRCVWKTKSVLFARKRLPVNLLFANRLTCPNRLCHDKKTKKRNK